MGLFDMFKSPEKRERRKRPLMPDVLLEHLNFETEGVYGTNEHQDALDGLTEDLVQLVVSPEPGERGHEVTLADGTPVGRLLDHQIPRVAIAPDETTVAEVIRPKYRNMDYVELYIPLTQEAIAADKAEQERKDFLESLKIWVNIDAKKWSGPTFTSGQIEYDGADFVLTERKKAKPLLSVVSGGATLTTFNARMKAYKDLMERSQYHIRLLIVKRYDGEYGPFYKLGFYF